MQQNIRTPLLIAMLLLVMLPACRDEKDGYRSKKEHSTGKSHHKKEYAAKKPKHSNGKHQAKKVMMEEESEM